MYFLFTRSYIKIIVLIAASFLILYYSGTQDI